MSCIIELNTLHIAKNLKTNNLKNKILLKINRYLNLFGKS